MWSYSFIKVTKIQRLIVCPAISQGATFAPCCSAQDGESADTNCQYNAEALLIVLVPILEALNLVLEPKLVYSRINSGIVALFM